MSLALQLTHHLLAQQQVPVQPLQLPSVEYSAILPELVLIAGALFLLVVRSLSSKRATAGWYGLFTLAIAALSLVRVVVLWFDVDEHGPQLVMSGAIVVDGFRLFVLVIIAATVGIGALLIADPFLRREQLDGPEFYVLLLLSATGAMIMAGANDLIVLFLGLEILSIALYVLAGFNARRRASREAALKYFILGSFSSALFLYGIALTYGATGSTSLPAIARYLTANVIASNGLLLAGMALLLVGFAFKVAAVPFHAWTPDVYEGSPSPVTGIMAAMAKAAAFAGLLRVFFSTFSVLQVEWRPLILALAVLTLVTGSVLAVVQTNVKRMLAYSSISHAGYVLIGLHAASPDGVAASLFYLFAYSFMVLGSFAVVTVVGRRGDARHSLEDYRGLASRRPGLAFAFTVLLLAQAGVPFTSGFLAKFYVITAAVGSRAYPLAVIGMLSAAVAAFFYLRVTLLMYSPAAEDADQSRIRIPRMLAAALAVTLFVTVVVGFIPGPLIDFAKSASLL